MKDNGGDARNIALVADLVEKLGEERVAGVIHAASAELPSAAAQACREAGLDDEVAAAVRKAALRIEWERDQAKANRPTTTKEEGRRRVASCLDITKGRLAA